MRLSAVLGLATSSAPDLTGIRDCLTRACYATQTSDV
jgi:hypothetical protein